MIAGTTLASVRDAIDRSSVTIFGDQAPIAELMAQIRTAQTELVLILIAAEQPRVDRTMIEAAIGPLAVERAPNRLCALTIAASASESDILAACLFLAQAASTTGQLLSVR